MRNLTNEETEAILSKKKYAKAKRIEVQNFLWTVGNYGTDSTVYVNLQMDTRLYKWNAPTVNAILEGISIASHA